MEREIGSDTSQVVHNHMTRDIKRKGVCPACDKFNAEYQFPEADSEGNYHN